MTDVSQRVNAALQERARQQHEAQWSQFISKYGLNILFPAKASPKDKSKKLKTDKDLINARLLENGILFEDLQTVPELQEGVSKVVDNLTRTGCFNSVQLQLGKNTAEDPEQQEQEQQHPHQIEVILDEKNWYSLYIGGGFKHEGLEESLNNGTKLPSVQFETSAKLLNLTGFLDQTQFKYTVDQSSVSSLLLSHERPLYSWLGEDNAIGEFILALPRGSQYSLGIRASVDTADYEWTRSYKEHQRMLTCRLDNQGQVAKPEMAPEPYWGVDWQLALRDVVPRKHASLPYAADASPEVVASSGTSMTHSVTMEARTNGAYCDHRFQPTAGVDWYSKLQLSGPPGDVGFVKAQGGGALHLPLLGQLLALHGACNTGYLQPLSFGGICKPPTISDRFFVGGPMQLRGFLPAGIGPRSKTGGSTSPGGDALGGSFFYTGTVAASLAPPGVFNEYGVRMFCFCNAGTLVGTTDGVPLSAIANSTRVSAGAGISAATPMGRAEATYAWPLRYGPRDARRNLQFGFGFNFG
jgi:outer membrane protein assembly factor BamA